MAKINPWLAAAAPLDEPKPQTKTFKLIPTKPEPGQPDAGELEISLLTLDDELYQYEVADRYEDYVSRYLEPAEGREPEQLIAPRVGPIKATRALCRTVATLQVMEELAGGEPYSLLDYAGLARRFRPTFRAIAAWASELNKGAAAGNPEAEATSETSATGTSSPSASA